jgi:hypothetical protein
MGLTGARGGRSLTGAVPRSRENEPQVPLHRAASIIQRELLGGAETGKDVALNSAALALSSVSEIWYLDPRGRLVKIPDEELAVGGFEGGAKIFRTRSGNVYESLSMRREDVADALVLLKKAWK